MPGKTLRLPTLNSVIIAGRCLGDLELFSKDGGPVTLAAFGIAITTKFERDGEKGRTCFLNVKVIGEAAIAHAKQHIRKGEAIIVKGRLDDDVWNDRDTGKERRATKLIAESIQPLAWPEDDSPSSQGASSRQYNVPAANDDDDVPF